jgi:hypothetical protein
VAPTLADVFERVSMALEHASTGDSIIHDLSKQFNRQLSMEESAQHHRRLAEEYRLVGQSARSSWIRSLSATKESTPHRREGLSQVCPVAVVNVHKSRCDALFVLVNGLDEVVHIPLPAFFLHEGSGTSSSPEPATFNCWSLVCVFKTLIFEQ